MADQTVEVSAKAFMAEKGGMAAAPNSAEANLITAAKKAMATEARPLHVEAGVEVPNQTTRQVIIEANTEHYDENGNIQTSAARRTEATNWNTVLERVRLNNDLQGLLMDRFLGPLVTNAITSLIEQNPALKVQWQGVNQADKGAVIFALLQDVTTKEELVRLLKERLSLNKNIKDNTEELSREHKRLSDEKTEIEDVEKTNLSTKKTQLEDEAKKFQTVAPVVGGPAVEGEYAKQLTQFKGEEAKTQGEVETIKETINNVNDQIQKKLIYLQEKARSAAATAVIPEFDSINTQIKELNKSVEQHAENLLAAQQKLSETQQKIKSIEDRRTAVQTEQTQITTRLKEIEDRLRVLNPELAKKASELHTAEAERNIKEAEFISSVASILPEAVAKTINERTGVLVKEQLSIEEKAKESAKTQSEKNAREAMVKFCRTLSGEMDWDKFNTEWQKFMGGDPAAFLDSIIPTGDLQAVKGNKEVYDKLLTDLKLKMGRLRMMMPKRGFAGGIRTFLRGPEQVSQKECYNIIDNLGEDYLKQMFTTDKNINDLIKQAGQEDIMNGAGKMSEKVKKIPLGLLILLLPFILAGGLFFGKRKG